MGLCRRVDHFFSSCGLDVAVALPISVFIALNLLAQLVILIIWGSDEPFALWEWSSLILPVVALVVAFGVAIMAVAGQLKRRRKTRLRSSDQSPRAA
jgi:hypothetical protein